MATEIAVSIVGVFSTVVSSIITFVLTKRKYNAEVDSELIKNMQDSLKFYNELSSSNTQKLQSLFEENQELRRQVNQLQNQVLNLMSSICYDATCKYRKLQEEINKKQSKDETKTKKSSKK